MLTVGGMSAAPSSLSTTRTVASFAGARTTRYFGPYPGQGRIVAVTEPFASSASSSVVSRWRYPRNRPMLTRAVCARTPKSPSVVTATRTSTSSPSRSARSERTINPRPSPSRTVELRGSMLIAGGGGSTSTKRT